MYSTSGFSDVKKCLDTKLYAIDNFFVHKNTSFKTPKGKLRYFPAICATIDRYDATQFKPTMLACMVINQYINELHSQTDKFITALSGWQWHETIIVCI